MWDLEKKRKALDFTPLISLFEKIVSFMVRVLYIGQSPSLTIYLDSFDLNPSY